MPDETRYELVITGDAEVTKAADIAARQAEEAEKENDR
jgi:hypothetical protein